jgi:hypothetical protein
VKLTDSETSGFGTIFCKGQTISYAGLQEFYCYYNDKYNDTFLILNYWHSLVEMHEVLLTVVILGGGILG